jgi:hypothetical protein
MTPSPAHVCRHRLRIYLPCLVWLAGWWGWRASLLTLAEAERVHGELGRLIGELRALVGKEGATRADDKIAA